MIKPNMLKKGDEVAIVSLSSGIAGDEIFHHRYLKGKERLEKEFGLKVKTMPHALKGSEFINLNPKARAKDLIDAFIDPNIKAIICNIGGDDTIRLLPYINFQIIKNNPKIFLGYSDSTINHFMLNKAGIVSYYGPSIMSEFAENVKMHDYTKQCVEKVLMEDSKDYDILYTKEWTNESLTWTVESNNNVLRKMSIDDTGIEILQGNHDIEGELIGGCIDTFHMFLGSEIWPKEDWDKKILFIETSEDQPTPEFISQIFRNPIMVEALKSVRGIIMGKPFNKKYYDEYKKVILDVIRNEYHLTDMFIAVNYNFGHTAPMCILPMGIKVGISSKTGIITFKESATSAN